MNKTVTIEGMKCVFTDSSITVKQGCKISYRTIEQFCIKLREYADSNCYKRSVNSWIAEMMVCKMYFELDWATVSTLDIVLDKTENIFTLVRYRILSVFCKIHIFLERLEG